MAPTSLRDLRTQAILEGAVLAHETAPQFSVSRLHVHLEHKESGFLADEVVEARQLPEGPGEYLPRSPTSR